MPFIFTRRRCSQTEKPYLRLFVVVIIIITSVIIACIVISRIEIVRIAVVLVTGVELVAFIVLVHVLVIEIVCTGQIGELAAIVAMFQTLLFVFIGQIEKKLALVEASAKQGAISCALQISNGEKLGADRLIASGFMCPMVLFVIAEFLETQRSAAIFVHKNAQIVFAA